MIQILQAAKKHFADAVSGQKTSDAAVPRLGAGSSSTRAQSACLRALSLGVFMDARWYSTGELTEEFCYRQDLL